jgi:Tfp pilus assembly protein PilO
MNKLPKEKKLHLVLVGLVTVGVMGGLWFGLIAAQQNKIQEISRKGLKVQQDIEKIQKVVIDAPKLEVQLREATNRLATIEAAMPTGDLFSYLVSAIKQFNTPNYKVEMPVIGAPGVGEVRMLPNFPYNQAVVAVSGTAYYYDLGKYIADMENRFPYLRVQNLSLEPGFGTSVEDHEKLAFRMEIVNLVKPNRL